MIGGLLGDFLPWIVGALAVFAGIFGYGRQQRSQGRKEGAVKRRLEDLEGAQDVREKLDAAKRDGDADDRLREQGRLRD